jgi:arylsulfatase A-like enzyme
MIRLSMVLALACISGCSTENSPSPAGRSKGVGREGPPPNILIVTLDTTRADRLGCYGHAQAKTPTLDQMAAEGILVERALAPAPITLPSHATLFTGLNPIAHGIRDNGLFVAEPDLTLLAEVAEQQGYSTAAFVSAHVLSSAYGLNQGFSVYDDHLDATSTSMEPQIERSADLTVRAFLEWQEQAPAEPWFLWMHFFDPHFPYQPPEGFGGSGIDPYDAEITFVDQQLRRLLHQYDREGRLDRTLLVITSDHGEGLKDHREPTHGLFVYDSTMHVPLIFRYPPWGSGKRLRGQVGLVDLFPSVLDLWGVTSEEELAGESLLPALRQPNPEVWHDIYLETQLSYFGYGLAPLEAVSTREFKYIKAPKPELYLWPEDPGELSNRWQDRDGTRHEPLLESFRGGRDALGDAPDRSLSEDERDRLERLGYVQSAVEGAYSGLDPKDAVEQIASRSYALNCIQRQQFDQAEAILTQLLADNPGDADAYGMLGHIHLHRGSAGTAIGFIRKSLSLRPDMTGAAMDLARAHRELGQLDLALAAYDQILERAPTLINVCVTASQACYEAKDFRRALAYLQHALQKGQPSPRREKQLRRRVAELQSLIQSS